MGSAAGVFLSKTLATAGVLCLVWCVGFKVTASACQAYTRTSIALQENQKGLIIFVAGLGGGVSNAGSGTHAILKQKQRCAKMFILSIHTRFLREEVWAAGVLQKEKLVQLCEENMVATTPR